MSELWEATEPRAAAGEGRYRCHLDPGWAVWGPFGGYMAVVALRAMAAETTLPRPIGFQLQFLRAARFDGLDLEVERVKPGRAAECLRVRATQDGKPVVEASSWWGLASTPGFEHDHAAMPAVPAPDELRTYAELADNYEEWYPVWQRIDAKPLRWWTSPDDFEPGPPVYRAWTRVRDLPRVDDPVQDAARLLLWLDLVMWNAMLPPHTPPYDYIAPSLDLSASFHQFAPEDEWQLADAAAPLVTDGVAGCNGRVWSREGRLLASGTANLICRPAPPPPETG